MTMDSNWDAVEVSTVTPAELDEAKSCEVCGPNGAGH